MTVREARADDADDVGRVHVAAWRAAYRGMVPDAYLDGLDPAARAAYWRPLFADPGLAPGDRLVLVADGKVSGFVACGPLLGDPGDHEVTGQVYAINADPAVWGRGGGSLMLEAAEECLRRDGHRVIVLWVAVQNGRARRFYERHGWWAEELMKTEEVMGAVFDEVRYRKVITPQAG